MADTSIVIRVDISGSNKVTGELDKIVRKTKEVDKTARLLRNAFAALGGAALAKQLLSIADTYTNIQNRLKLVTSSTAELATVQNQLLGISNNTRQSFEETVATYTKAVSATKQLGLSQRDTLKFTELLNKTVAQSGASTTQAAAGLQQLSQGLGSGALRGDELNSILENLPNVADLISQELNVTRGELRQLGSDGKISAQVIIDSFLNAEKQINEGFGKVAPTIGQSFTVLQNQITVFFGSLAQSSGFSEAFARGLLFIANNIDTVVRLIGVLALTITQVLVQRALVGAVVAIKAFVTALTFSNFITAAIQGIYLVTAAIVAFSDKLKLTSTGAATLADFFIVAFQKISATVKGILIPAFEAIAGALSSGAISTAINKVADNIDTLGNKAVVTEKSTTSAFQRIALAIAKSIDNETDVVIKGSQIIKLAFTSIVTPIENAFIQLSNSIAGILNGITTAAEKAINVTKGFFGSTQKLEIPKIGQQPLKPEAGNFFEERQKILDRPAATGAQDFVKGLFSGAEDRAQKRLEDEAKRKKSEADALNKLGIPGAKGIAPPSKESVKSAAQFAESIRDLQAELDLLKEGNQQLELRKQLTSIEDRLNRPLSPGERDQATSLIQQVEALREQSAALTDIQGPQEAYVQRTAALDALLQKGAISQSQYTFALQAAQLPFERSISDLDQQIELLQLSETAHARQSEILRIEAERGEALSASQRSQLESRMAEVESLQAQNSILSELRGPQEDYAKQLEALEGLHQRVGLSAAEYNSVLSDIRLNYLETQNTASAGFQTGLLTIQKQFGDVAGLAQDTLVNAFGDAEDALVEFVETGKFNFKDLTDSILADITRLAIRQSITAPLAGLLGGAAAGGGGGGGGGLLGGIFSAVGGLFSKGGGGSFNNSGFSGGFALAEGGRFRVGGTGGVDSQFVPLHLTPGELIEVTPPGQSSGTTVNYFIQTNDADSFRASQAQIMRDTQISLNRNTRKLQ